MEPKIPIIIPTYEPDKRLSALCQDLKSSGFQNVLIVDDGSGARYRKIFDEIEEEYHYMILRNAVNLGKGRALKLAFNHCLNEYGQSLIGVITADSDGQHKVEDIRRCMGELRVHSDSMILGCRDFSKPGIPWKSSFGNNLTKFSMHYLCGLKVTDTQTGLRGIPREFMKTILSTPGDRYDYETNVLLESKGEVSIIEVPIDTIYDSEENHQTHFDPFRDSLMIYKVILSYSLTSVLTTVVDFIVFAIANGVGASIAFSTALARLIAAVLNFSLNRNVVFKSKGNPRIQVIQYGLLVAFSGFISANLITLISHKVSIEIVGIKAVVETILFFFNYLVQRLFIFTNKHKYVSEDEIDRPTDWTKYYEQKKSWFSTYTQKFTLREIIRAINQYVGDKDIDILELGGGNSCFAKNVCENVSVSNYDIVDNNELAVKLFERQNLNSKHKALLVDLLNGGDSEYKDFINGGSKRKQYDFVYSIGLIEHFRGGDIDTIIKRHFEFCKDGGVVFISFPTPTVKYRSIRFLMELVNAWQFWDEKPLKFDQVKRAFEKDRIVLEQFINRKLPLTQMVVVVRKSKESVR